MFSLPVLTSVGLLGVAVGFGLGHNGKGSATDAEAVSKMRVGDDATPLKPTAVTASLAKEKAADGELRPFQPGRPFPRGAAEAWLLEIAPEWDDMAMMRSTVLVGTLDLESTREVTDAIVSIWARVDSEESGEETEETWGEFAEFLEGSLMIGLGKLAEEDPEGAIAVLGAMEERSDEDFTSIVWAEIARHSPGRVKSLLARLDGATGPHALAGALQGLIDTDLDAGIALLENYRGEDFEFVWADAIGQIIDTDPRRGTEMAASQFREGQPTRPLTISIGTWLREDEAGARKWVESHQGPGRNIFLGSVLMHDAYADPRGAMAAYAAMRAQGASEEALDRVPAAIMRGLASEDIQEARAWVDALPEGKGRVRAIGGLANYWVREENDTLGASEWIATLPKGEGRDEAAGCIVEAIYRRDPAAAFEWARSISDESERNFQMANVLREWREQDPSAAAAAGGEPPEQE